MIQLIHDRTAVHADFVGTRRRERLLELFRAARDGTLDDRAVKTRLFSSSRWKNAKPQLELEANGKCAFCETPTSAAYYGDIEHFRPKSVYWWLAYCYDNYLYSCRVCNGKKSDQHELSGQTLGAPAIGPGADDGTLLALAEGASPDPTDAQAIVLYQYECALEQAHLPSPYADQPERLFQWNAENTLKEVRLEPRPGLPEAQRAFQAADTIIDLNREELRIWRWRTFDTLLRMKSIFDIGDQAVRDATLGLFRELAEPAMPYSAMVRYFTREQWGLPL